MSSSQLTGTSVGGNAVTGTSTLGNQTNIKLRVGTGGVPLGHDDVDANFELVRGAINNLHDDLDALTDGTLESVAAASLVIDGAKIKSSTVDTSQLSTGAVTNVKLGADAVDGAKIADDAIDSEHYTDGSIDTAHIADDQVTLAKMAGLARGKVIVGDASGNPAALALGASGYVLKSDGTDIAWSADATVASLTQEEVEDIVGGMFTSNTETGIAATYQDGDGTIDLVIGSDVIVNSMIAADAIDSAQIADGSIDTAHIADDQVTLAKMDGLARGKLIVGDSSGNPSALAIGSNTQVLTSDGTDVSWAASSGGGSGSVTPQAGGTGGVGQTLRDDGNGLYVADSALSYIANLNNSSTKDPSIRTEVVAAADGKRFLGDFKTWTDLEHYVKTFYGAQSGQTPDRSIRVEVYSDIDEGSSIINSAGLQGGSGDDRLDMHFNKISVINPTYATSGATTYKWTMKSTRNYWMWNRGDSVQVYGPFQFIIPQWFSSLIRMSFGQLELYGGVGVEILAEAEAGFTDAVFTIMEGAKGALFGHKHADVTAAVAANVPHCTPLGGTSPIELFRHDNTGNSTIIFTVWDSDLFIDMLNNGGAAIVYGGKFRSFAVLNSNIVLAAPRDTPTTNTASHLFNGAPFYPYDGTTSSVGSAYSYPAMTASTYYPAVDFRGSGSTVQTWDTHTDSSSQSWAEPANPQSNYHGLAGNALRAEPNINDPATTFHGFSAYDTSGYFGLNRMDFTRQGDGGAHDGSGGVTNTNTAGVIGNGIKHAVTNNYSMSTTTGVGSVVNTHPFRLLT